MLRVSSLAIVASLAAHSAFAGGIERSAQPMGLLFEEGTALQFSFNLVAPELTGSVGGGALSSGDMAPSYTSLSFGYKQDIGERFAVAVIFDQSVGADVDYTNADPGYPLLGTEAELNGHDVTALVRYKFDDNFSVYGGLRAQKISADLTGLPIQVAPAVFLPYELSVDGSYELGYVVGTAYERKDIALRVALTYNSAIDHTFDATETVGGGPLPGGEFTTTIPQSVNLEFQTGIAANTLLFGSVRWQDWSEFDITPPGLGGASLIDYESDYITYNLGVGRRFNENWAAAVTLGYEGQTGDIQGNLAPRDGFASIGLAATYTMGNTDITAGVRYIALGDATTQTIGAEFSGNDAIAAGVRVTTRF